MEKSIEFEKLKIQGQEINITTPENKTYTEPMSGYYPATYGFENDEDGSDPSGWGPIEDGGTCNIIASEGNHLKVVELNDISALDTVGLEQTFTGKSYGSMESWWRITDANQELGISMYNGEIWVISISMKNNEFIYWASGIGWQNLGHSVISNKWYHIRIDFECTTDRYYGLPQYNWQVYINGTHYGTFNLINNESQIDSLYIVTNPDFSNYKGYIDAVGYSWDPNYNVGDNIQEGLLLNFDIDFTPDWIGYSLDGQINKTILGIITLFFPDDGKHNIQIFGNNSFGYRYKSDRKYFSIDTMIPKISINFPHQNDFFNTIAPNFEIIVEELNINSTWYTLDGGITNISFTELSGTINQTEWKKQLDGPVMLRFYVNDSFSRLNWSEINIYKDTSIPIIIINSPEEDQFFAKSPYFNISISDLSFNSSWYTLDNGNTNFSFTGLTGTIDQEEWNKKEDGPITVRFYANDSFGLENYVEITIFKDTINPEITIHSPIDGEIFTELPPYYNISITESNLDLIWYTIDNGLTNITTIELTGYIDSSVWNAAPNGAITIKFYALDKAGNEGQAEKIVVKKESQDGGVPPIFGYNLLIVFGIISVMAIFFYKKINK